MIGENSSASSRKMSAEDFISKLDQNDEKALEIHRELERLTSAFVKKNLGRMFGHFDESDITEIVNQTFLIVYTNYAKGKTLNFDDPPKSLQSYFWRVADNLCKAFRRGKYGDKRNDSLSDEDEEGSVRQFAAPGENPEDELLRKEREKIYPVCQKKILDELREKKPDDYRLLLSYFNERDKSAQEMKKLREDLAVSIGTTPANLTLKVSRIKVKLREQIQKCLSAKGL